MSEDKFWQVREWAQTMPQHPQSDDTEFYRGVKGIRVDLVDSPRNPYKALFCIATATWGGSQQMNKWANADLNARVFVVNAVLGRKCLPNAMEAPSFTFEIAGPSRSAFDQIARARIGAVFGSLGTRDNCHTDIGIRVPEAIWQDLDWLSKFVKQSREAKKWYQEYLKNGQGNWQDARAILPMSICHRWSMAMNYMAMQNFMSKRLQFNEQADTVATAWLMRERVKEQFPLLASYLRPASDHARKCVEHVGDEISQAFGNLFRCSGRFECDIADDKYTFNTSCSDRETIMQQLDIHIPEGTEDMYKSEITFEELADSDKVLFEAA
jgi:thymidylate synthase ThyX